MPYICPEFFSCTLNREVPVDSKAAAATNAFFHADALFVEWFSIQQNDESGTLQVQTSPWIKYEHPFRLNAWAKPGDYTLLSHRVMTLDPNNIHTETRGSYSDRTEALSALAKREYDAAGVYSGKKVGIVPANRDFRAIAAAENVVLKKDGELVRPSSPPPSP